MQGWFITFEGGEGAGKSTQIERLRHRLEGMGHPVRTTREPGGSPKAEHIRAAILGGRAKHLGPVAEAFMFYAARHDHLEQTIRPAIEQGIHVLCDRFADSTRAYQGARGEVGAAILSSLERVVVGDTAPDLTFILDLPAKAGLARAGARQRERGEAADRFEAEAESFHEALRDGFLAIAAAEPERCAVIDAAQPPDAVEAAIWAVVEERAPALAQPPKARAHVA